MLSLSMSEEDYFYHLWPRIIEYVDPCSQKKLTKQSLQQKNYFPCHEEVTAGREGGENRNKNNSKLKRQVLLL